MPEVEDRLEAFAEFARIMEEDVWESAWREYMRECEAAERELLDAEPADRGNWSDHYDAPPSAGNWSDHYDAPPSVDDAFLGGAR